MAFLGGCAGAASFFVGAGWAETSAVVKRASARAETNCADSLMQPPAGCELGVECNTAGVDSGDSGWKPPKEQGRRGGNRGEMRRSGAVGAGFAGAPLIRTATETNRVEFSAACFCRCPD